MSIAQISIFASAFVITFSVLNCNFKQNNVALIFEERSLADNNSDSGVYWQKQTKAKNLNKVILENTMVESDFNTKYLLISPFKLKVNKTLFNVSNICLSYPVVELTLLSANHNPNIDAAQWTITGPCRHTNNYDSAITQIAEQSLIIPIFSNAGFSYDLPDGSLNFTNRESINTVYMVDYQNMEAGFKYNWHLVDIKFINDNSGLDTPITKSIETDSIDFELTSSTPFKANTVNKIAH